MSSLDLMRAREEEIGKLVLLVSEKSHAFTRPKLAIIGGYALRAHLPFARYSRDCDFVLKEGLGTVDKWRPKGIELETMQEDGRFMRWSKPFGEGKRKALGDRRVREGEPRKGPPEPPGQQRGVLGRDSRSPSPRTPACQALPAQPHGGDGSASLGKNRG